MTDRIELSKSFPVSMRNVAMRVCPECTAAIVICGLVAAANLQPALPGPQFVSLRFSSKGVPIMAAALIVFFMKAGYALMYRQTYTYAVRHGRLLISRGVFMKAKTSLLLDRITDIYITRSLTQFLFGLATLEIRTPTEESKRLGSIEGLSARSAEALQRQLLVLISRKHRDTPESSAAGTGPHRDSGNEAASCLSPA